MKQQHSSPEDFPHKMYHQHLPNYVDRYSPHLDTDSGQERYKQEHGVNIHQWIEEGIYYLLFSETKMLSFVGLQDYRMILKL